MNETCLLLSEAAFQWVKVSHPLPPSTDPPPNNPLSPTTITTTTTKSQNQEWLSMCENVKQAGPGTHYDNETHPTHPPQILEMHYLVAPLESIQNVFTVTLSMLLMYTDTHTHTTPPPCYKVPCALQPHHQLLHREALT